MEKNTLLDINSISAKTREKIVEILDIMIYKLEMILATDLKAEKRTYIETRFHEEKYNHINLSDVKMTSELLEKQYSGLGFTFPITGINKTAPKASWEKLHQVLKRFRNAIKIGNPVTTGDQIISLEIIEPENSQNQYLVVVNNDYDHPIKADRTKFVWRLLFEVAKNKEVKITDNSENSLEYLSTHKKCKLYTKTGLSLTKILKKEHDHIKPVIDITILPEKAYTQRKNKLQ